MSRNLVYLIVAIAAGAASAVLAQQPTSPSAPAPPPTVIAPPAPAFKMGAIVTDRTGARLGPIQSVIESDDGPMVVIEIDGKLISVPQSTLVLKGEGAVSSQTRAEIVAAAGVLR